MTLLPVLAVIANRKRVALLRVMSAARCKEGSLAAYGFEGHGSLISRLAVDDQVERRHEVFSGKAFADGIHTSRIDRTLAIFMLQFVRRLREKGEQGNHRYKGRRIGARSFTGYDSIILSSRKLVL